MSMAAPASPHQPISADSHNDEFSDWALQAAGCVGLEEAVREYPEQVIRAAAIARAAVKALEDDMSGTALLSRPAWSLLK